MTDIYFTSEPSKDEIESFHKGLNDYNGKYVKNDFEKIAITVKSKEDIVVAGIDGMSYWGRAYIDNLWVDENYRREGIGSKLLKDFEIIAKAKDCLGVQLSTMSFQAIGFYEKNGYETFAKLGGFADGHYCIFYTKEI